MGRCPGCAAFSLAPRADRQLVPSTPQAPPQKSPLPPRGCGDDRARLSGLTLEIPHFRIVPRGADDDNQRPLTYQRVGMSHNRRKHPRRDVDQLCWFDTNSARQLIEARLCNISQGGAKVYCATQAELPDSFDLYMTSDGKVGRRCKVVWRSEKEIGLMFLGHAAGASTSTW
jgi:hypothetical protein